MVSPADVVSHVEARRGSEPHPIVHGFRELCAVASQIRHGAFEMKGGVVLDIERLAALHRYGSIETKRRHNFLRHHKGTLEGRDHAEMSGAYVLLLRSEGLGERGHERRDFGGAGVIGP